MTTTSQPFDSATERALVSAAEVAALHEEIATLKQRVAWFEKQLFGQKSEKRPVDNPHQASLLGEPSEPASPEGESITVTYQRGKGQKQRADDCVNDSGLRFNDDVPVEVIEVTPAELSGADADQYDIIGTKSTFRLAQRPASYVVLRYDRPVIKRKNSEQPLPCPAPFNVLDRSIADVSLLVGLLVDKFQFHLPLYRQHQRISQAGITLSRATLTNVVKRAIDLLRPVVSAQLDNVLRSRVLAMDETPIKAGKAGKGKLKHSWFWPLYGDQDEVVFTFSSSRSRQHIERILKDQFSGTLLSDGYSAYSSYVKANQGVTHAQCWIHSRRQFIEAEAQEPVAVREALDIIAALYKHEAIIAREELADDKKRGYRLEHSKPLVDQFFKWCHQQLQRTDLIPSNPLTKALGYVINKEQKLRVFLERPGVAMDTNHLERALRPIPMGRKSWLFCWTELGAEHVGIIQSLITTCRLHGINPYTYLTDVLLRISEHPASRIEELTPRLWKERFALNPLRSDLSQRANYPVETPINRCCQRGSCAH
ncbi:IS66 family transposase [Pseudomaricurvus alcaniphilus]|uniref:IS66 family transposase n=1 Tax=Pseudomaricurvus alcaniphilus TaxID=1166482 RepID=UPI001A9EB769